MLSSACQAIGAPLADQHPVSTRVRTLSSRKNGLPSVRSISSCLSGRSSGRAEERVQQLVGALGRQGIEPELL